MNWFRQNRFLGTFFIVAGLCAVGCLWFLFKAKSDWDEASTRFSRDAAEVNRSQALSPFPSESNVRNMKAHAEDYATALAKLKDELKKRVLPVTPMAPNEFQSRLRLTTNAVAARARANKVKLPNRFYLGFDEFASALPATDAASLLGQELAQIEWLVDTLVDARVDAVTALRRAPAQEQPAASPGRAPATAGKSGSAIVAGTKLMERRVVETTFVSTPAAARKVLNQIAGSSQQFYIIRLLHVRNEKEKGPPRDVLPEASNAAPTPSASASPSTKQPAGTALNFIVGNERIETTAKIEIVRFTF